MKFRDHESLDRLAANDVGVNDLFHVLDAHAAIPDLLRINNDRRPELAGIETSSLIDAHGALFDLATGRTVFYFVLHRRFDGR